MPYDGKQLRIEYFVRPGSKAPLLYLHGLGCSKDDFTGAADQRELKDYTLIGFDFPGCGGSPYPDDMNITMEAMAEITSLVVKELALDGFVLIGHSMGGLVALLYLLEFGPETGGSAAGFVNVEGNLTARDCFFSRRVAQSGFENFKTEVFPYLLQELVRSRNEGCRVYAETLERYSSVRAYWDSSCSLVAASARESLLPQFLSLDIPSLFVYGEHNRDLPYLPTIRRNKFPLAEVPGSGHFPGYDNPKAYYRIIARFTDSLSSQE